MQISYNWLKNYVKFGLSPEDLSVLLTDCGLEVEALEKFESIPGGLAGVVTGKIVSCSPHPNADKLSLAVVETGKKDPLPIVCGAPNVKEGQTVLVATVGSKLHTPNGVMEIRKAKIRGEVSEGMICAEDELGLGDSHEGIMVLPEDTPAGMPASEYFKVETDWVYEIGLTPNRIDAASHIGAARDVAAVLNHQNKKKAFRVEWPDVSSFSPAGNKLPVEVDILDTAACPRYSSLTIDGVRVGESPDWLKNRLKAIGLKPINNIVDITNFVLHETGQPLHAFDLNKVKGNRVVVKKPPKGTHFETLDGEKLELTGADLMICNEEEAMCMAGILGGINSGVTGDTSGIFLESACFDAVSIRKSARYHGLNTDASFRFERGSDPEMTVFALKRAAEMIRDIAGGEISSEISDLYPGRKGNIEIELSYARLNMLAGKDLSPKEVRGILEDLDFEVLKQSETGLMLSVPGYRVDVTRDADVIEEVLRIYGYNNIEVPGKMHSSIVISPKPDNEQLQNIISDLFSSRGFSEIMNNSLTKAVYYEADGFNPASSVIIQNPLSQDLSIMRQSLLFGGLETIAYNRNRKIPDMKLYEFGNVYSRDAGISSEDPLNDITEKKVLALFLTGRLQPENWRSEEKMVDFFDLKESVNTVFSRLGIDPQTLENKDLTGRDSIYAYSTALFSDRKKIAQLGLVSAAVLKKFGIREDVYYASLEWDKIVGAASVARLLYNEVPRFPEVRRDLALLMEAPVSFSEIEEIAYKTEKRILKEVNLFDVYQDEKLGKGKKSYAVSFVFRDDERTLTDAEVDKVMEKLVSAFGSIGAYVR